MLLERIKQLCISNGITISELEHILKFGNGTISRWASVNPSIKKVKLVAEYFGIGIEVLVYDLKIPSKESRELAYKLDEYSTEQKNLIKSYILLISKGKEI